MFGILGSKVMRKFINTNVFLTIKNHYGFELPELLIRKIMISHLSLLLFYSYLPEILRSSSISEGVPNSSKTTLIWAGVNTLHF